MKKSLTEELHRMHSMMYGSQIVEQEFIDRFLKDVGYKKDDDPTKADLIGVDVDEFFDTLETAAQDGGISQQERGSYNFKKEVESMQVGLIILGYDLPIHGVDGLFGPETAEVVEEFTNDHVEKDDNSTSSEESSEEGLTKASEEMLLKMIELLKEKNIDSEDLKKLIDPLVGNTNISLSGGWLEMTKQLIRKFETFTDTASDDEGTYRGGYGTSKKLVGGKLVDVTPKTTWTLEEAEETLDYQLKNTFAPIVASQLGPMNWEKLNDSQKAALLSFSYNAGPYVFTARDYGKNIKNAIVDGDMEAAAAYIAQGPTTGAQTGQYYPGLSKRRNFESQVFLN
jgi:GH24 family phage-related lysozyme (muramidase)